MLLETLSKQELIAIIHQQAAVIEQLTARVEMLEKGLVKNSHNSHRSPSSDGLKKNVARKVNEKQAENPLADNWGIKDITWHFLKPHIKSFAMPFTTVRNVIQI